MHTTDIRNELIKLGTQKKEIEEKMNSLCDEYAKKIFPFEEGEKVLVKDTYYTDKEIPGYFSHVTASYSSFQKDVVVYPHLKKVKKDGTMSQVSLGYFIATDEDIRLGRFHIRPFVEE